MQTENIGQIYSTFFFYFPFVSISSPCHKNQFAVFTCTISRFLLIQIFDFYDGSTVCRSDRVSRLLRGRSTRGALPLFIGLSPWFCRLYCSYFFTLCAGARKEHRAKKITFAHRVNRLPKGSFTEKIECEIYSLRSWRFCWRSSVSRLRTREFSIARPNKKTASCAL